MGFATVYIPVNRLLPIMYGKAIAVTRPLPEDVTLVSYRFIPTLGRLYYVFSGPSLTGDWSDEITAIPTWEGASP
jgi:hypothetical protein